MPESSKISNVRGFADSVRLHRFRDCLAVSVTAQDGGTGRPVKNETVYLSSAMVWTLANLLREFTATQAGRDGGDFPTRTVDAFGRSGTEG